MTFRANVGLLCAETRREAAPLECPQDAEQKKHSPKILFHLDARKPGNLNTGHRFGTSLPESDKYALVEYLKTI